MIRMNEHTFYANVGLMECRNCGSESIISIERAEKLGLFVEEERYNHREGVSRPWRPYCGSRQTRIMGRTTDENRAEFHFGAFTLCEHEA